MPAILHRLALFLLALILLHGPASAQSLRLNVPETADLGMPFLVSGAAQGAVQSPVLTFLGRKVPPSVSRTGNTSSFQVLLGTDMKNIKPGPKDIALQAMVDGRPQTLVRTIDIRPKHYAEEHLTLPEKMVTPPKAVHDRIAREGETLWKALETTSPTRHWKLPLKRPVNGKILSRYGKRRVLNGKPRTRHAGVDFRAPLGTPVRAVEDGTVVLADNLYFIGNGVVLDHGNGVVSVYAHFSKTKVKPGDKVKRGQVIGLAGASGRASGPHLHMGVYTQGQCVNPLPLFEKTAEENLGK